MDPLSITASVIAIATAAAQLSKAIAHMRAFGEMPARVHILKNEVSDLEVVLRQIEVGLRQQQGHLPSSVKAESLEPILVRTKEHLSDLATVLERIAKACEGGKAKIIGRTTIWWKEKTTLQDLQAKIRTAKESLILALGSSNSFDLRHIMLELHQVTVMTSKAHFGNDSKLLIEDLTDQHQSLRTHVDQQYQDLSERLDTIGKMFAGDDMTDSSSLSGETIRVDEKKSSPSDSGSDSLHILVSHRAPCRRNWCPCVCHTKQDQNAATPQFVQGLLGKMFVGYTGMPLLNKKCDFRGCGDRQGPSATMEYWFPRWFVSMNMKLSFQFLPRTGPQLQLSTTRRVPDASQSITFAMQGNTEGLKYLFTQGLAHPRDVSESRGFSLVRWALYGGMHQYKTVQFLMEQGASVDDISYENVWDFSFRGICSEEQAFGLKCITEGSERDWVEEQNFPLVHRIMFGLSSKKLADELDENPNAIYIQDAQGRTALDWAIARKQLKDAGLLLAHGADPNSMDVTGRTTVLHAVDSHYTPGLQLVLSAGGDPNPKLPKGVFRSSPLTASSYGALRDMVKLLLEFEADPNACNPEGLTALHRTFDPECALLLLEYGGDLNALSSDGRTPLTTAIMQNNHAVLRLFIDRCFEYITTARLKGPQLLPIIAEFADLETMHILGRSKPLRLSYDLSPGSVDACQQLLTKRPDLDEKLADAFDDLITTFQADENDAGSAIDSLVEHGLYLSAASSFHSELAEAIAGLASAEISTSEASDSSSDEFLDSQETPG